MEKTFLRNKINWDAFSSKVVTLTVLRKKSSFFRKRPFIFTKNQTSVRFEKSYYFHRIVRQICYKLVIEKFQGQNVQTKCHHMSDIIDWQVIIKKRSR